MPIEDKVNYIWDILPEKYTMSLKDTNNIRQVMIMALTALELLDKLGCIEEFENNYMENLKESLQPI